jgi:Fic family protein
VNEVNRSWETTDPVVLATYVLWRINNIHPFINGNGRTARAACYFALCLKSGGWLSGNTILPELIRQNHAAHVAALQVAHDTFRMTGAPDLTLLHALIAQLVAQQIQTASPSQSQPTSGPLTTPQQPSAAGTSPQQTSPTAPGQPIVVPPVTPGSTSP